MTSSFNPPTATFGTWLAEGGRRERKRPVADNWLPPSGRDGRTLWTGGLRKKNQILSCPQTAHSVPVRVRATLRVPNTLRGRECPVADVTACAHVDGDSMHRHTYCYCFQPHRDFLFGICQKDKQNMSPLPSLNFQQCVFPLHLLLCLGQVLLSSIRILCRRWSASQTQCRRTCPSCCRSPSGPSPPRRSRRGNSGE